MTDDSAPAAVDFRPAVRDRLMYVLAKSADRVVGLFVLVLDIGEAEVHFSFLPEVWGRTAEIGRAFVAWIWRETSLERLVGPVPAHNRLALRLAKECGFSVFGTQETCVVKDGRTYGRILLEARRDAILR